MSARQPSEAGKKSPLDSPSPSLIKAFGELEGDLQRVLGSAAEAADRIVERAEGETSELVAERRRELEALGDRLAEQAHEVRNMSNDLMQALERQTQSVERAFDSLIGSLEEASRRIGGEDHGVQMSQRRTVTISIPRRPRVGDPETGTVKKGSETKQ